MANAVINLNEEIEIQLYKPLPFLHDEKICGRNFYRFCPCVC